MGEPKETGLGAEVQCGRQDQDSRQPEESPPSVGWGVSKIANRRKCYQSICAHLNPDGLSEKPADDRVISGRSARGIFV